MIYKINDEQIFQVLSSSFTIGPSETGYELQVGATSRDFSTLFSVGANTPRMVTNVANGSYFRLLNNQGEVEVNWTRTCKDGGSGGGADVDLSAYWTSAETQSAITIVEDHLFDVEQVTASALTELHDGLMEVSARTVSVDLSAYYTSAQTEEAIAKKIDGYQEEDSITITSTRDAEELDVIVAAMGWMGPNFNLYLTDADVEVAELNNEEIRMDGPQTYVRGLSDLYGDYRYGFDTSAVLTPDMLGQRFSLSQAGTGSIELNEAYFPTTYPRYFVLDKANMEGWFADSLSTVVDVPGVYDAIDELQNHLEEVEEVAAAGINYLARTIEFETRLIVKTGDIGINDEYVKDISKIVAVHQDTYDELAARDMLDPYIFYIIDNTVTPWDGR